MKIRLVVFKLLNAEYNVRRWQFAYYCNFISISCFTEGRIFGVKLWDINELWIGRAVEGGDSGLVLGTAVLFKWRGWEKSRNNVTTEIWIVILSVTDKYLYCYRRNLNKNISTDFSKKRQM
jgi:hypothetical protein